MKNLLCFLKDYKKESILAPLFKMLEASFELIVPLVMAAIIDRGIGNGDISYIVRMCLVMIGLGIVGLICSVTAQFFAAKAAVGFATGLRHELFAHIQSLSYTEIDTIGTSTMITRMTSDINQAQSGVNMALRLFLRSPFVVFGAMIMAFSIDGRAAMIFAVTIPLLSLVVFGIMAVSMPLYKKVQQRLDAVLGMTRENLTGIRVIRAFHKETEETENFKKGNDQLTFMQLFVGKISALMNPVTYVIINGALIVLIHTGAVQVNVGILTQGQVVALINYMSQILVELIKLANLIVTITKALACAKRISSVLEIKSTLSDDGTAKISEDTNAAESPLLQFRDISFRYAKAGEESLSDVNFSVNQGETIGVIGGTGSGKSTLVNLIPRFYEVTKGELLYHGKPLFDYPVKKLREKIGVVPQKAVLFQGTLRENMKWGNEEATDEEILTALEISQAKEFTEELEGGLDFGIAQGGKNLSGGQKQRLTIARALVKNPEILILDDSASALDYATDAKLRMALKGLKDRLTVFIVSQRTSSIQFADKILVLDDGNVAGIGTHEELLNTCEVYREIYESQYRKPETKGAAS